MFGNFSTQSHTPFAVQSFTIYMAECNLGNQELKMRNVNKHVVIVLFKLTGFNLRNVGLSLFYLKLSDCLCPC